MKKENIKIIVFDLDQTLFNHLFAEKYVLFSIFQKYFLCAQVPFEKFYYDFTQINLRLWRSFEKGQHDVEYVINHRFRQLCRYYPAQIDVDDITRQYTCEYIKYCAPFSGVKNLLSYLARKGIPLVVCSNGHSDIQSKKLVYHHLNQYFMNSFYGNQAPLCKPYQAFFNLVKAALNISSENILFIGDSLEHDIYPAQKAGMNTLHIDKFYLSKGKLAWRKILTSIQGVTD